MAHCGWDIGGVHLKRSRLRRGPGGGFRLETAVVPFEIWKDPAALAGRLGALAEGAAGPETHAVTMTAELADVFARRADGVRAVLDAVRRALPGPPARVLDLDGTLVAWEEARERPLRVAAANWCATARLVGRLRRRALLIDIGSTTTDIVPVRSGRPAPSARTDTDRLLTGELVYTGAQRTPPAALAEAVPLRGGWCRLATEHFAITADVYRVLGRLSEEAYTAATPDGRGRGRDEAAARLARVVCGDRDTVPDRDLEAIAAYLEDRQIDLVVRAVRQVLWRDPDPPRLAIVAGAGRFLAAAAAGRAGLVCERLADLLPEIAGAGWDAAAPSAALALLLAEEAGVIDLRRRTRGPDRGAPAPGGEAAPAGPSPEPPGKPVR
jgi:hypothetical protein